MRLRTCLLESLATDRRNDLAVSWPRYITRYACTLQHPQQQQSHKRILDSDANVGAEIHHQCDDICQPSPCLICKLPNERWCNSRNYHVCSDGQISLCDGCSKIPSYKCYDGIVDEAAQRGRPCRECNECNDVDFFPTCERLCKAPSG